MDFPIYFQMFSQTLLISSDKEEGPVSMEKKSIL